MIYILHQQDRVPTRIRSKKSCLGRILLHKLIQTKIQKLKTQNQQPKTRHQKKTLIITKKYFFEHFALGMFLLILIYQITFAPVYFIILFFEGWFAWFEVEIAQVSMWTWYQVENTQCFHVVGAWEKHVTFRMHLLCENGVCVYERCTVCVLMYVCLCRCGWRLDNVPFCLHLFCVNVFMCVYACVCASVCVRVGVCLCVRVCRVTEMRPCVWQCVWYSVIERYIYVIYTQSVTQIYI